MKTEISRDSHQPEQRYSGVYQQQGRMLTDADWNELVEILKERLNDALRDVVGRREGSVGGVPRHKGLKVLDASTIQPGHIYVDGVAAQVLGDEPLSYADQQDFPDEPDLPPSGQPYKFYADIWERTVTHLMDERLRDKGLHGADTCTRKQVVAQVKWCPDTIDPEQAAENPARGNAELSVTLLQKTIQPDSCDPCADTVAVASRVGNYLFRVEVHDVQYTNGRPEDGIESVTLKWSSENGAEQYKLKDAEDNDIDPPVEFSSGNWAYEFFDETSERHLGVHLADTTPNPLRGNLKAEFSPIPTEGPNRFVRRWDGYCTLENSGGVWSIAKDADGIQGVDRGAQLQDSEEKSLGYVRISPDGLSFTAKLTNTELTLALRHDEDGSIIDNRFVAGDFWLAEVREAEHETGSPLITNKPPQGIEHRYLWLGTVNGDGNLEVNPEAGRKYTFPPLTEMTRMFIAGGDGQEAMPGNELPYPLQVDVANGEWPVNDAEVLFTIEEGAGALSLTKGPFGTDTAVTVVSGSAAVEEEAIDGVATCYWKLGLTGSQRVRAELLGPDGTPMDHPPVYFNAGMSLASDVAYDPSGKADRWRDVNAEEEGEVLPTTVQEAIDDLVDNLQSEDIRYTPSCTEDIPETVRSMLEIPTDVSSRVHQILDKLLCEFNATHLPIEKNEALCSRLNVDKVKSVQDALDALCRMERSGGGCSVTVGENGGQHPTLKDAFEALAEESDISLCLLPGNHQVAHDLVVSGKNSIRISGAGSQGSVIDVGGNMKFDAGEVQLRDLGVNVASFRNGISLKGRKISSDNCAFARVDIPENLHRWAKNFRSTGKELGQAIATDSGGNMLIAGYFTGRVDFGGTALTAFGEDLFVLKLSPDGKEVIWVKNFRNTGNERGLGIAVDAGGNVVVTGHFDGEVTFGKQTLVAEGTDLFVLRLDAAGSVIWARNFRSSRSEYGNGVAVDPVGNILLTGYFEGVMDADGKWLMAEGTDLFVIKLEPKSGGVVWAHNFKNKGNEYGMGIAVDREGYVHVTGYFDGAVVFDKTELEASGIDMFVVKFEPEAGNVVWAQQFKNEGNEHGMGIAIDAKGYVCVTGYFDGAVLFGETELVAAGVDMFVVKFEPEAGNVVWAQQFKNEGNEHGMGIAMSPEGSVYVTGYFDGTVLFGETELVAKGIDMFVVKLKPDAGNVAWAQNFESRGNEHGMGIAVDAKGYVHMTGYFDGAVLFGRTELEAEGIDMFAVTLEPEAGAVVWARDFANLSNESASAVAVDYDGNVLVAGSFSGAVEIGGHTLVAKYYEDLFVLKLDREGNVIWVQQIELLDDSVGTGSAVSVDRNGNVLVTGKFQGNMVVGGQTLSATSPENPYVVKLEPEAGKVIWVQQFKCTGNAAGHGVSVDSDGNVLVTGNFQGQMTVGKQTLTEKSISPYVVKLERDKGEVVWAQHFTCTKYAYAYSVAVDRKDNVLVTGLFQGQITVGNQTFIAEGLNPFVLKLEPDKGEVVWAQHFECSFGRGDGISVDLAGNVLVSGVFSGRMVAGNQTFSASIRNPYLLKLEPDKGDVVWARHFICTGIGFARSVSADRNGHVLVTGNFVGEMRLGTPLVSAASASGNTSDMFVMKLSPEGRVVWAHNCKSTGTGIGYGVAADPKGDLLVAGQFQGTMDFGDGSLSSTGSDMFIAKLSIPDAAPPLVEVQPASENAGADFSWNRNSMSVRPFMIPFDNPGISLDGLFDALALSDSSIGGDIENNRISGKVVLMSDLPGELDIDPEGTVKAVAAENAMPARAGGTARAVAAENVMFAGAGGTARAMAAENVMFAGAGGTARAMAAENVMLARAGGTVNAVVAENFMPVRPLFHHHVALNIRSNEVDNICSRLPLDYFQDGVLRRVGLSCFDSMLITNNVFGSNESSFFATRMTMSGNQFIGAARHSDVAAVVVGNFGTFSDNQAHRNAMIQRVLTSRKQSSNELNFKDLVGTTGSESLVLVNGDEIPAGTVMPFAAGQPPDGWLECNGASKSKMEFAALYDAIGITFGNGDGNDQGNYFNLPNLRDEFVRGWNGKVVGAKQGYATALPINGFSTTNSGAHSHTNVVHVSGSNEQAAPAPGPLVPDRRWGLFHPTYGANGSIGSSGSNHSHAITSGGDAETRPRNVSLMFCIKY